MGNPRELLDRIKAIVAEKSDDDIKTLIAIDKELGDVDAMNEWSPRDAAYWATRPVGRIETKLHESIHKSGYKRGEREGVTFGVIIGAGLVGLALLVVWIA